MFDQSRTNSVLHEQQDWLRVTLSSFGDAVVTTDTDGRITFLNPVAVSLTGWTLEDAVGKPLEDVVKIINQDTRLTVESPSVRALRDGVIVGLANHTLLISKDGTECPIDDSAAPIRNERNEIAGVMLVFRDISERHRQEQAIQDTLAYANNIIATLREPFLVITEDLKVETANRAFYSHFRTSADKTEGRMVYDLGTGQWDIPRLRALLTEALSHRQPVLNYEVTHDFPVIGVRFMLLNAVRIRKPGDQSDLILLAFEDITDRKAANDALAISEVRYRRLFESAKDGILILDFDTGRITDANPFITDLLGYPDNALLGKDLWEIGLFRDKSASENAVLEMQQKGDIRYEHLPLETTSGRKVEVEVVAYAYKEAHGPVIQCNIRDITERAAMERKVHEQTEALADLHRRKDEFLAMLSHELRNPLAPIANAVQLLRLHEGETPIQRNARGIIERQMEQLTRLIDDLMEISRITTGRIQLRHDRIAIGGVVVRAVESVRSTIAQHGHELTVDVPPQPIWLHADASRLEQVVVNLLSNAAKYTGRGGHIWISAEQRGDECVLMVRDTGIGISPELLPRIFDLFTQAEGSLDRAEGGLGIGLALVHRLVEMHHGRVDVTSSLGRGSEFIVRLPLLRAPESPPPTDAAATTPSGASLRVLVVDDNVDAAQSLDALLSHFGHESRMAHDGPAAVASALAFHPDVALLDIGLPELNGYEVARRIRAHPSLADVVLVAMTGYGLESDRELAMEAGFDHHLTKPADFKDVLEILSDVAQRVM